MTKSTNRVALLALTGALISLVLLSFSLPNLELKAGSPFPSADTVQQSPDSLPGTSSATAQTVPIARGLLALVFLVLLLYIPARLFTFISLKQLLRLLIPMAVTIAILYFLPSLTSYSPEISAVESYEEPGTPDEDSSTVSLEKPPQELIWVVLGGLGVGLAVLAGTMIRKSMQQIDVEDQLLQEAEQAVNSLQAGMDLRNVILRCYMQMNQALLEDQGIERSDHLTAREFEDLLAKKGFPPRPVAQLTHLYEKVRYGKSPTDPSDEALALTSMQEIIKFCREQKVGS